MNFEETWVEFLNQTKRVGLQQIKKRKKHDDLAHLLEDVIALLTHEAALSEVRDAVNKLTEGKSERERGIERDITTVALFERELRYITIHRLKQCTESTDAVQADAALDDAKTGKDSLEAIFGKIFTKWLKNKLEILNEILKLIHGN